MNTLRNTLLFLVIVELSRSSPIQSRFQNHKNFKLLPKHCGIQDTSNKIFAGNYTELGEFPWMGLLEYQDKNKNKGYHCAGSLINNKYILTAAHCVTGQRQDELGAVVRVRLGENDYAVAKDCIQYGGRYEECSDDPVDIEVEEIISHKRFNYDGLNINDIALIRLKTPVKYSDFVRPVCLPLYGETSNAGEILIVSGWGYTEAGIAHNISTNKQKAKVPVITNENCTQSYENIIPIKNSQLCAGGEIRVDTCFGDSGSPLMKLIPNKRTFYIEGIVSFGPAICGTKIPGVYTRVGHFVKWILDNIKE